jgi:nucleoside-specific outer membrane channel protein Tsx
MKIETKYIVAIIISLIVGASVLGYGYLDYRYKNDALEQKIKSEEQIRTNAEKTNSTKQLQLQGCLNEVVNRFSNALDASKNIGNEEAKIIIDLNQKQKDECFRKYKN